MNKWAGAMFTSFPDVLQEELSKQVQSSHQVAEGIRLQQQTKRYLLLSKYMASCPLKTLSDLGNQMRQTPNFCNVPNLPTNLQTTKPLKKCLSQGFLSRDS